jgi:hypothetical protein
MSEAGPVTDLTFRIHHTMLPVADLDRSITLLYPPVRHEMAPGRLSSMMPRDARTTIEL